MSTVQRRALRHRYRGVVGAACFALGILIAIGVGFVILTSAKTTKNVVTQHYRDTCRSRCVGAERRSATTVRPATGGIRAIHRPGITKQRFYVDPGSGFAMNQGHHRHGGVAH
jgi:hypothetical protein